MKTKSKIWFCSIILSGAVLILIDGCKKNDNNPPYMTDQDGNVYASVTIGSQVWTVENLKTTRYSNGDLIGTTVPDTLNISSEFMPKYQWAYDGIESNVAAYGRLYTWWAVNDSRKICPAGWHVPSDEEWTTLSTYLGGDSIAGGKLKKTGTIYWIPPNRGATNEAGFKALPGGYNSAYGTYFSLGITGYWWTSSGISDIFAYYRAIGYSSGYLDNGEIFTNAGLSVRCLHD